GKTKHIGRKSMERDNGLSRRSMIGRTAALSAAATIASPFSIFRNAGIAEAVAAGDIGIEAVPLTPDHLSLAPKRYAQNGQGVPLLPGWIWGQQQHQNMQGKPPGFFIRAFDGKGKNDTKGFRIQQMTDKPLTQSNALFCDAPNYQGEFEYRQ